MDGAPQNVEAPLCLFYISITSLFPYHSHLKPQYHKEVHPLVLHQISGLFLMYFLVAIGKSIYKKGIGTPPNFDASLPSLRTTHSSLLYPVFLQSSRRSGPKSNPLLSGGAFLIWLWCCRRRLGILDFLLALLPHI